MVYDASRPQTVNFLRSAEAALGARDMQERTNIMRDETAARTQLAERAQSNNEAYRAEQIKMQREEIARQIAERARQQDMQESLVDFQNAANIATMFQGEPNEQAFRRGAAALASEGFPIDPNMPFTPEAWDSVRTITDGLVDGLSSVVGQPNPLWAPKPEAEIPSSVQALQWRAQEAGLQPGSPEYRQFIQSGGKMEEGINLTLPDGTIFQQGNIANMPSGQNPTTTSTPRDGDKLSAKLTESDAAYLSAEREKARAAEDLETLSQNLGTLSKQVGYTGPFGGAYGKLDDAIGILPGDSGARGAFRSQATEAQLTFTERTKGAITEREMALFAGAVPNLNNTNDANAFISKALSAGARRVQTRHKFMEAYAARRGSLEGAEGAWDAYMNANPMLVESDGQLQLRDEGNWQEYVARDQAIDMTPERLSRMTPQEASMIDVNSLNTEAQIDALMRALGAQ